MKSGNTHLCKLSSKTTSSISNPYTIELEEDDVNEDKQLKNHYKLLYTGKKINVNAKTLNVLFSNDKYCNKISYYKINFSILFNVFRI